MKEVIDREKETPAWVVENEEDLKNIHRECLENYGPDDERALTGVFAYKPDDVVLVYLGNRLREDNPNRYPLFTNMKESEFAERYK